MVREYNLRLVEEKDLSLILAWRNSDRIRKCMYGDHIITEEEHIKWFRRLQEKQDSIYLIFEWKERPCGMVYFLDADYRNKKCYWGFYLGEDNLPKGIGYIMGLLGLEYAFRNLEMRKICGEVFAFNNISINFHKKLGFIQEGYFRCHVLKEGKYQDIVLFSLFKDMWVEKVSLINNEGAEICPM